MGLRDVTMAEFESTETEEPKLDEEGKPIPDFFFDEESPNLVAEFTGHPDGKKALEEIGDRVIRDFLGDDIGQHLVTLHNTVKDLDRVQYPIERVITA